MLSRPPSSADMAILNPIAFSAKKIFGRDRAPSKITARVGCAFQPILRSLAPNERPGVSLLDNEGRNAARRPASPVRAITI